jgi:hypothetical protein
MRSTLPAKARVAEPVDLELHVLADLDARDVGGRHLGVQRQLFEVDDGEHRAVRRQLLAGLHMALADHAGERRVDHGVVQGDARQVELGAGRVDRGLGQVDALEVVS